MSRWNGGNRVTDELRSHHLRTVTNVTMDRYRPRNIDGDDFSSTAFDDAKKITARRDRSKWRRICLYFHYVFENKHVGKILSLHLSTNID